MKVLRVNCRGGIAGIYFVLLFFPCLSQVKINEVHVQPVGGWQSEYMAHCMDSTFGAEWVEIYNTSLCDTVDLGCYLLASRTADTNHVTFAFPSNTIIPPLGFLVVGGANAPSVDFKVSDYCISPNYCGTGQWFLSNSFGWIALYDPSGTVVDAVYWTPFSGQASQLVTHAAYRGQPCVPLSCAPDTLPSASQMSPGNDINYAGKVSAMGLSLYRQTDGGILWLTDGTPTPRACNDACTPPPALTLQISSYGNETCLQANGWALAVYSGGTAPYDIDWSNRMNADSITGLAAGCYSATVTDSLGCRQSASVCIINIGTPVNVSIFPPQATIFKGESVPLALVTQANLHSIQWTPSASLSCSDCAAPIASPLAITTYTVAVVDADGCTGSATATVAVLSDENSTFIPTAFTPNNDLLNDVLYVRSPKLKSLDFKIFDRWGTEVFATTDASVGWNGRDKNGKEVDAGIYVYYAIVSFENGKSKTLKGNVAVLR